MLLLLNTWMPQKWSKCAKERTLPLSHMLFSPRAGGEAWGESDSVEAN